MVSFVKFSVCKRSYHERCEPYNNHTNMHTSIFFSWESTNFWISMLECVWFPKRKLTCFDFYRREQWWSIVGLNVCYILKYLHHAWTMPLHMVQEEMLMLQSMVTQTNQSHNHCMQCTLIIQCNIKNHMCEKHYHNINVVIISKPSWNH